MIKEKVLVAGSGARDHCLAEEYAEHGYKTYIAPGNPGIKYTKKGKSGWVECVPLRDPIEIAKFCKENNVVLVDAGSENVLDQGIVDVCNAFGIATIGPRKEYVRIESDREFTDKLLMDIGVRKPEFAVFDDPEKAKKYVKNIGYQVVVKANGLASGKGCIVCDDVDDAIDAIETIMVKKKFGKSGEKVVIEERKYGEEISFFVYLDGEHVLPLKMFAKDYKPAFDPDDKLGMFIFNYGLDDKGIRRGLHKLGIKCPENLKSMNEEQRIEYLKGVLNNRDVMLPNLNTGGTGCYCPHKLVSPHLVNRIIKEIVNPTVNEIYRRGWRYKGVLYFGLNRDPDGRLDVFEINVRHGDPEAEVILRKLETSLFEIGMATWNGRLDEIRLKWNKNYYVDVIAMVGRARGERGWYPGYPGRYGKGYKIRGLEDIEEGIAVFYSGVDEHPEKGLVTSGGRVLHIVASDPNLDMAIKKAYRNIEKIKFLDSENKNCLRYRRTIGLD